MNILIITKRQYTNKDLIDDQYGRLWEIPFCLFNRGHNIKGICLSYRCRGKGGFKMAVNNKTLQWISFDIFPLFFKYIFYLISQIKIFKPDVIWASSDCFHIVLGWLVGKLYRIPCVVDLYDNYEAFTLSKLTGIIPLYRLVVKNADGISVISEPLKDLMIASYQAKGKLGVVENAVNTETFHPREKIASRKIFNLPVDAIIIGTAGALDDGRGIDVFYEAFANLSNSSPMLHLAVAGPGSRDHPIFHHSRVHDMGVLAHSEVANFLNMLDLAIICNKDSDFGRYCFPQKAYEILASGIPLISANVGTMALLLKNHPECLYNPADSFDLAEKIAKQLKAPSKLSIPINTWAKQGVKLEILMENITTIFRKKKNYIYVEDKR